MLKCRFGVGQRLGGFHLEHRRDVAVGVDNLDVPSRLDGTVRQLCVLAMKQVQIPNPLAIIEPISNQHFEQLPLPTIDYTGQLLRVHLRQGRKIEMRIGQMKCFVRLRRNGGVIYCAVVQERSDAYCGSGCVDEGIFSFLDVFGIQRIDALGTLPRVCLPVVAGYLKK